MFGWFKKKLKKAEAATQTVEEKVEAIIEEVKKESPKKHIDCECKECIRRIKNAK